MSKFVVRNLRTSIVNLNKRIDELEAGDLDILKELLSALEFLLEEVGDPTPAIDKYNEIISFLDLIENTSKLKSLLDDIRNSIPEAPVQSDWAEDDVNDQAYIKNKPTIPTKVSDLTNNSDFLQQPHSSNGHEYVEIAGIKWATENIGATYENDPGLYFAWGETEGYRIYADNSKNTRDFSKSEYKYAELDGSDYVYTKYNSTDGKSLLDLEDDAARANWGGNWRIPTPDEFGTLFTNCIATIVRNSSGNQIGFLFTDKTDSTKSIYFPGCRGRKDGIGWDTSGYDAMPIWTNQRLLSDNNNDNVAIATASYVTTNGVDTPYPNASVTTLRYSGRPVRAILDEPTPSNTASKVAVTGDYNDLVNTPTNHLINPTAITVVTGNANGHDYVDLGLPSGTLWATVNVGALTPTDYGNYYQFDGDGNGLSNDTVTQLWGGSWHMPTKNQFAELRSNTTYEWTTINGVSGGKYTAQNGNYIFFPAAGSYGKLFSEDTTNLYDKGTEGRYLSSTIENPGNMPKVFNFRNNNFDTITDVSFTTKCSLRGVLDPLQATYTPSNNIAAIVAITGDYNDLNNKPDLSTVATTGSYNDLTDKPEIIRVVEINGNLSNLTTSVSGIENDGKKETVIYVNNTENTYYITVSNSYKTLRNTQLSLVACPGGYCEVSYINKGGIIFAKGLIMGVKQSDSNSKYILATYDVTNTNAETPLISSRALSTYADMEIDGELLPSLVASYNFDTVGEHTVKFILPDLEQFDEQNGIMFGDRSYSGSSRLKSIVLPEGITTIPDLAFYACKSLESVTLPSTIKTIGNSAFGSYWSVSGNSGIYVGCDKLSSINIPNGVTSIGYGCFAGCTSLTSITIPNSVTSLGYDSFSRCTNLTTVSLGTGLTILQQEMFRGCTSLTDVTIPNTITSILQSVFCECSSLQTIVIPDSVTNFGGTYPYLHDYEGVFAGCTSLTNVTLGNNIVSLKGHDFYNCTSLQTLNIPDKLKHINSTAFKGCSSLTAFNVSNNNANLSSIDGVIYNKDATWLVKYPTAKQGTFTIPSTVTNLGDWNQSPFVYCNGITTIEIGLNVSSIYPLNFSECSSLTAINVDVNNQTYSSINGVLYNKNASKLIRCPEGKQSVTIPNTVTELDDYAFMNCANITNVNIPNSVTTIGYSSFDECTNLSSITIPSSVTSIEDCYNFDNCTSLPVIDDIRYADTYAIRCTSDGKSTYTIKSGTRFIGNCAFEDQENLQNITIPSTVIAMGDYVFDNCSKLLTITFEGMTAPDVRSDTFRGVKSLGGTIRVPANSTGYDVIMQKNGLSNWTKVEY